jgi:hypothetical protein
MNPTDFHKTAKLLSGEQEEAHIRTTINRSYYGLFLYLREFLTRNEVRLPDRNSRKSHHQFILECIHEARFFQDISEAKRKLSGKSRPKDGVILGIYKRLQTLLQNRTEADYNLHVIFRINDGQDSLRLATETVEDFSKLRDSKREKHIINIAKHRSQEILNSQSVNS